MRYNLLSKLSLKDRRGYTLLFAVIVSALVLSIGAFIVSISRKQFILSSTSRDSMLAFYASDSSMECAVEIAAQQASVLSTSSIFAIASGKTDGPTVNCGNQSWQIFTDPTISPTQKTAGVTWQMLDPGSVSSCSVMRAWYVAANGDGTGATQYFIDSRGYNIGWASNTNPPSCSGYGPRRVERALRYTLNE